MALVTFNEAAKILGRSRQTISNWVAKGIFKVRNIGGTNYIDDKAIYRFTDTLQDIEDSRIAIERLRNSLREEREYITSNMIDEKIRRRYYSLSSKGEFFVIVVKLLVAYGSISEKQGVLLVEFLRGKTIEELAEKHGVTREAVRNALERAMRKGQNISEFENLCKELNRLRADNDALKRKVQNMLKYVKVDGVKEDEGDDVESRLCNLLSTRVSDIKYPFSTRALVCLKMMDIETVGDICKLDKFDFLKHRGVGKLTVSEIEVFLKERGLSFDMDVESIYEARAHKILH